MEDPRIIAAYIAACASFGTLVVQVVMNVRLKKLEGKMYKQNKAFDEELRAVNDFYDVCEEMFSVGMRQITDERPTELPKYEPAFSAFKRCVRDKHLVEHTTKILVNVRELMELAGSHATMKERIADPELNKKYTAFIFYQMRFRNKLIEYRTWLLGYGPRPKPIRRLKTDGVMMVMNDGKYKGPKF